MSISAIARTGQRDARYRVRRIRLRSVEQVSQVHDAHDVVLVVAGHREPRVGAACEERQRLVDARRLRHRDETATRGHDLPRQPVLDVEHAGQHLPLHGVDEAARSARPVEAGQLLGRVDVRVAVIDAQPPESHERERRAVEQRDQRTEQPLADPHRRQRGHRQALRMTQCDRLRQQLAEHDLHGRDRHQHDQDGDQPAGRSEQRLEQWRELRLHRTRRPRDC